jgi:hypothetical protein
MPNAIFHDPEIEDVVAAPFVGRQADGQNDKVSTLRNSANRWMQCKCSTTVHQESSPLSSSTRAMACLSWSCDRKESKAKVRRLSCITNDSAKLTGDCVRVAPEALGLDG